jgi:hypothetical protein
MTIIWAVYAIALALSCAALIKVTLDEWKLD